ncbi:uncharacterized protein N7529_006883 [Penicillium soppii]|uniref:uncharacterized protein n=1 Tax=Penicillium soppii TaxID=69789 RepID=UPI00254716B0|nr:uncharacterized protein N7529_006883 [Penicillium soppii]KAJ5864967.1 hypothetical protein N7529_006883 [Penicillium soppii]
MAALLHVACVGPRVSIGGNSAVTFSTEELIPFGKEIVDEEAEVLGEVPKTDSIEVSFSINAFAVSTMSWIVGETQVAGIGKIRAAWAGTSAIPASVDPEPCRLSRRISNAYRFLSANGARASRKKSAMNFQLRPYRSTNSSK